MPKRRHPDAKFNRPKYSQAAKIVRRFGGEVALAAALGIHRTTVYRWQMAYPFGRDGVIPTRMIDRIKSLARLHGVLLRERDWEPEVIVYKEEEDTK